jgi:hypothetical protein
MGRDFISCGTVYEVTRLKGLSDACLFELIQKNWKSLLDTLDENELS